jgi:hypothetical protein
LWEGVYDTCFKYFAAILLIDAGTVYMILLSDTWQAAYSTIRAVCSTSGEKTKCPHNSHYTGPVDNYICLERNFRPSGKTEEKSKHGTNSNINTLQTLV